MSQSPNLANLCPYSAGQNKYHISTVILSNNEGTGCSSTTATQVVTVTDEKIVSTMTRANSSGISCLLCGNQKSTIQTASPPKNLGNEKGNN